VETPDRESGGAMLCIRLMDPPKRSAFAGVSVGGWMGPGRGRRMEELSSHPEWCEAEANFVSNFACTYNDE